MYRRVLSYVLFPLFLLACESQDEAVFVGSLERQRVELVAEANEPIMSIPVVEGDVVAEGDVLVVMDARQHDARLKQAQAARARSAGRLAEMRRGPRVERIDAARARLQGAENSLIEIGKELTRARRLRQAGNVSQAHLDGVQRRYTEAVARRDELKAQLEELLQGATAEELVQAEASLAEADAALIAAEVQLDRMSVKAPRSGRIDALPYEVGERPMPGAVVAVLLAESRPFAKIYVPADQRAQFQPEHSVWVRVDGVEGEHEGRVRFVSSQSAFTPFFALTEHDRSRFSYLAEIDLVSESADEFPTGIPVEVRLGKSGS